MIEQVQSFYDDVYQQLKQYLKTNSIYKPEVLKDSPEEKIFPLVIIKLLPYTDEYTTLKYTDIRYEYGFEINVYAMQQGTTARQSITNEISNHVEVFFKTVYRMNVKVSKNVPNEDTSVARDVVQATCILDTKYKDKLVIYPSKR